MQSRHSVCAITQTQPPCLLVSFYLYKGDQEERRSIAVQVPIRDTGSVNAAGSPAAHPAPAQKSQLLCQLSHPSSKLVTLKPT